MATEAEKVEMEQVPLKEGEKTEEEAATTVVEKKQPPKKTWFFQKDKKVTKEGEEEKCKKKCFWARCQKPKAEGEDGKPMSIGIDLTVRDEKALNDHVKINFEDVFGEPDAFHSWDCVWRLTHRVFEFCRTFFYRLFTLFICLPAAIIFGFFFALISALNTFIVVPTARLLAVPLIWLAKAWNFVVSYALDPLFRSCGLCLSAVSVRKYGINNAPTDLLQA